jgi:chaperonin GroES
MPKGRPKKNNDSGKTSSAVSSAVQATSALPSSGQARQIGIKPLMGYVLVEPSEAQSKTASGLYLPETAQEKPAQGIVVSLGDPIYFEGKEILPPVRLGDEVIYKKWGGDEIKYKGKEYKLVKFEDLMAVVSE